MTDNSKILLIANNFPPVCGGSAVVYDNLANHAAGRLLVLASSHRYTDGLPFIGWREHDRRTHYRVMRLPLLRTVLTATGENDNIFRRIRFLIGDLVIRTRLLATVLWQAYSAPLETVCIGELVPNAWLIHFLSRIPFLRLGLAVYIHGEEITTYESSDPQWKARRRALQAVDRIIVVSRFTQAAVLELIGARAADKLVLIENGVDLQRFQSQAKRPDLVEQYKLQDCFVFVSVCRLLEKKGIDNVLRAIAGERARLPKIRYLVVGSGEYRETLERLVSELGIADIVVFTGQVSEEELVPHYCLGDVFVMPNRELPNGDTEGFGLVFLEANACGIPVIAGKDGGSRDAVQNGINGLVVDGKSVPEIATALVKLRHDVDLRERLRKGGSEVAAAAAWSNKTAIFLEATSKRRR